MRTLILILPVLLVTACSQPQTEADPNRSALDRSAPAGQELTQLLNDFLEGASVNDHDMHDRFWAEDLIYTSSSGVRRDKEQTMEGVRSSPEMTLEEVSTVYTAEDIQIQQYGDMAVVAFRLVATSETEEGTQVSEYLNSGTFAKRDGQWKAVNWQATAIPAEES
ncbi:MAG: nuclear transport factor 2 family protein [Balneolaceae bacterium]|nr:nuclear transport factor 2 family protein [Balneolaceae bacterium]